jgi:acetoin utilization deacetylase AcuC-like enzyme
LNVHHRSRIASQPHRIAASSHLLSSHRIRTRIACATWQVAILDFDVHHGNGDAEIASYDPSRLYVSSHECPSFPGTGDTYGRDGELRNLVNVPLPPEAGSDAFRRAWSRTLLPAVRAFQPEAIFVSAGFDAHAGAAERGLRTRLPPTTHTDHVLLLLRRETSNTVSPSP